MAIKSFDRGKFHWKAINYEVRVINRSVKHSLHNYEGKLSKRGVENAKQGAEP